MPRINIRMSDEELKLLEKEAKEAGFTATGYAKYLIMLNLKTVKKSNQKDIKELITSIPERIENLKEDTFIISSLFKEDWAYLNRSDKATLSKSLAKYMKEENSNICINKKLEGNTNQYKKINN